MQLIGIAAPFSRRDKLGGPGLSPAAFRDVTSTAVVFPDHEGPSIGIANVRCAADCLTFRVWCDPTRPEAVAAFEAVHRGELEQCSVKIGAPETYAGLIVRGCLDHVALVDEGKYPDTAVFALRDEADVWDLAPPAWGLLSLWFAGAAPPQRTAPPPPAPRRSTSFAGRWL